MKLAQMGGTKWILGFILMLGVSVGGLFYFLGDVNAIQELIAADPYFFGMGLLSGFLFGFIVRRGSAAMNIGSYSFFAVILSAAMIFGYGFMLGDPMSGINRIMENLPAFLVIFVGGVLGGLVAGSPY